MNITNYLKQRLTRSSHYTITFLDRRLIKDQGIEVYIFSKLKSKKFRKWKFVPGSAERTKLAIHTKVTNNLPLVIIYPKGGYKLWRLPTSPEVDWAEFFNISYVLKYIAPLAAGYKPGVQLTYYLHTLLMEVHDNLPTAEIDAYVRSFQSLIDEFQ
jgi:hypothetical protein